MEKKILIKLQRFFGDAETTIGRFTTPEDTHLSFTIEDEYHKVKQHGDTRIPEGEWELDLVVTPKWSKIMGHPMITILVPGFTSVLIHPLNNEKETEGCVGPNETIGYDPIRKTYVGVSSKTAYAKIYPALSAAIKKAKEEGFKPTIKIECLNWKPYEETGKNHVVVQPPADQP